MKTKCTGVFKKIINSTQKMISQFQKSSIHIFMTKKLFTQEEDDQLKIIVSEYGPKDWKIIAQFLPGRNSQSCRERWFYTLSPNVSKKEWTNEEDDRLLELVNTYGHKWAKISQYFSGRTDINIKNRFNLLDRHHRKNRNVKSEESETNDVEPSFDNVDFGPRKYSWNNLFEYPDSILF